jgi:hypothetical protein
MPRMILLMNKSPDLPLVKSDRLEGSRDCSQDGLRDRRDNGSNHFCRSYKMFFAHADDRLNALAMQWRRRGGI